MREKNKKNTY